MTESNDAEPSRDTHNDKHVHYEDMPSSASDDDSKAVEVTFDPTNPYRRKSSLVTADAVIPNMTKRSTANHTPAQCLVHQFIEDHRRGHDRQKDAKHGVDGVVLRGNGDHSYVEPKGTGIKPDRVSIEHESDSSDRGQVDEKSWKTALTKSSSELDMAGEDHEGLHSRLLTKKQLSDMAWGVRELSRRLGSVRLKFRAKTIFLLTKIYDHDLIPKTREVAKWLLSKDRDVRYTVYVQDALEDNKEFDVTGLLKELRQEYEESGEMNKETPNHVLERRLRFWEEKMCRARPHTFDFIITLGGDGTVLYTSWLFQRIVPPVLSFSLGSLGFLTKFDFNEYEDILNTSFRDGVTVSLRLRFEGTVMRSQKRKNITNGQSDEESASIAHSRRDLVEELIGEEKDDEHTHRPDGTYEILNEIVVDRGPNPTMSNTEIFGDDEHFTSVLADGLCVSTPTGSTAYNLAAGGSLCHPENPVMLVTAICAHTLSFRPIILPDTIVLRIGVPYDTRTNSWASFDGRERIELQPGDYVTISASRFPFASVQPQGRRSEDWVNSISGKLGWNTRQKQKNEGYKTWEK
ncbi:ATP-NAD kinase [Xylariaceae sp. FL0016]|nr:ATP-NAD kinase [Xylariaceae sp. FL0016]